MADNRIDIFINAIDNFTGTFRRFREQTRGLEEVASAMARTGRSMMMIGGAGLAGLGYAARQAAKFSTQMAFVGTQLEANTMSYLPRFSRMVRDMSVEFGEGSSSIARGLYEILSATFSAEEAPLILRQGLMAARAGMTDTATATKSLITLLKSFGLGGEYAADMADWSFAVVKRGVLTYEELANSIGRAASFAAVAGLSLEDFGAAIMTMTRAGLNAEITMTAIRTILSQFLSPSKEAAEAGRKYGIELNTETLRTIGLIGVLRKLRELKAEQVAEIFPEIRAMAGVSAALEQLSGFEEDRMYLMNRAGKMQEAYNVAIQTTEHHINRATQAIKVTVEVIGDTLAPVLEFIAERAKRFYEVFSRIPEKFLSIGVAIFGTTSGMIFFGGVMLWLTGKIMGATLNIINFVRTINEAGGIIAVLTRIGNAGRVAISTMTISMGYFVAVTAGAIALITLLEAAWRMWQAHRGKKAGEEHLATLEQIQKDWELGRITKEEAMKRMREAETKFHARTEVAGTYGAGLNTTVENVLAGISKVGTELGRMPEIKVMETPRVSPAITEMAPGLTKNVNFNIQMYHDKKIGDAVDELLEQEGIL